MKTNINTELFKRYAPKKKLAIIEALTQEELLAITPKTVMRIVREAGEGRKGSPNKHLKIRLSLRQGNNWNSTFDGVGIYKKRLYVCLYVQMDSTDTETTEYYSKFFARGERYRGTCQESDRYGNPNYHYFYYNDDDKADCIKSILLEYVNRKYFDQQNAQADGKL